jgi:two-component system, OmpR family, response regulator
VSRILVVEDDPAMSHLLVRGLTDEGYDVEAVGDGIAALVAVASGEFAAAAIDVMLPEMSGFEVCRRIREQGIAVPILLLTARDAVEDRVKGLDAGADDYLIKPFAFAELSARLRAMIRRDAAAPRAVLELGQVALDTSTLRVAVGSKPLSLSSKEFGLLRFFLDNPGVAVDRTRILDEVWGTSKHIDPNVVDQYVGYLRRKLEPLGSGVRITTLRGVGYLIEAVG